ncbi:hypothetical protein LOK49_LG06G01425 [Camellia lanceoleosa]|uniref:Uncharacterized protein n=1 Tax=Camellia lanceoleosa TaxID=1840588 RepID=A0ACC0HEU4_9ERIC|nr:hypothetical protein LOK49_LG06G01425 [Camellia lanceoleosa]
MARKVLSPLVARRRGRPCTKQKVSKVDAIVNRLKGKNKKANPGQKVRQGEPRKLSFPVRETCNTLCMNRCPQINLTICLVWMPHKTVCMYRHRLTQLWMTLEAHLILKLEWSTILAIKVSKKAKV